MRRLFQWLRRLLCRDRCKHHYRKHWFRNISPYGGYAKRCTLCGKVE